MNTNSQSKHDLLRAERVEHPEQHVHVFAKYDYKNFCATGGTRPCDKRAANTINMSMPSQRESRNGRKRAEFDHVA